MAEAAGGQLTGTERAAVLLLSVGEAEAAEVLKFMEPKEVSKLSTAMAQLNNVGTAQVEQVLDDFLDSVGEHTALGVDSEDYIRRVLSRALGEEKAAPIIERVLYGANAKGIETLRWMEPRMIVELIRGEHPQFIALILCYLDRDQAASVLSKLPADVRNDALMRLATLDTVQPTALRELNEALETQMSGSGGAGATSVGGVKMAAEILNFVDSTTGGEIIEAVKQVDADLGQKVEDDMFTFENLLEVDDLGIQKLLRDISSESMILALKGADDAMREKCFKNMSRRAAEMMRDDLEAKGPVRVSAVEEAQKEIVAIARRLSEEGEISLGGGDGFV